MLVCGYQPKKKIALLFDYMCMRLPFIPWSIAGVPSSSSQALLGYLITAPPSVCVPDVIGMLAFGFQTNMCIYIYIYIYIHIKKEKKKEKKYQMAAGVAPARSAGDGDDDLTRARAASHSACSGPGLPTLALPVCAFSGPREPQR